MTPAIMASYGAGLRIQPDGKMLPGLLLRRAVFVALTLAIDCRRGYRF